DTARVDVESVAEIPLAHGGALDVPAGPALAEWRVPRRADLFVMRLRLLTQREVADRPLVVLVGRHPGPRLETSAVEVGQLPVGREARDAEVHVTIAFVRVAVGDQGGDHVHHL